MTCQPLSRLKRSASICLDPNTAGSYWREGQNDCAHCYCAGGAVACDYAQCPQDIKYSATSNTQNFWKQATTQGYQQFADDYDAVNQYQGTNVADTIHTYARFLPGG